MHRPGGHLPLWYVIHEIADSQFVVNHLLYKEQSEHASTPAIEYDRLHLQVELHDSFVLFGSAAHVRLCVLLLPLACL